MNAIFCKICFPIALILILASISNAQVCEGNIGDNIFEDGDFGTGMDNNIQTDPGIAPGYTYIRFGPPNDGFYVLTNDMSQWANLFPTWLPIQDNSNDPDGYMMVVNASFDPGIFYEQTISGFCENTMYEFSADIINLIARNVTGHIRPNVDFLIDGVVQYSTGEIPQNETWTKYGFTFTAPDDRTEITLTLRNNAPGGIGNDLALDNISFRACGPKSFINTDRTIFLCEESNQPSRITADLGPDPRAIQWQISTDEGATWNDLEGERNTDYFHNIFLPGRYQYRYLSAGTEQNLENILCRVISEVITIVVQPIYHEIVDTICEGLGFQLGSDLITAPGVYTAALRGGNGCDSNVTLDLTILPDPGLDFDIMGDVLPCSTDSFGIITFSNGMNGRAPYTFFYNSSEVNSMVENLPTGSYDIEMTDRYGCSVLKIANISSPAPFIVNLGSDIDTVLGAVLELNASSSEMIISSQWTPNTGLSCSDCPNPTLVSANDITYVYEAMNINGCIDIDSIQIRVRKDDTPVFIPNIFSPNGDNINDVLSVSTFEQSVAEILELRIYDRWGNKLYNGKNLIPNENLSGWDGTSNGKDAPTGVYLYVVKLRWVDDTETYISGDCMLVR
ncbi:MAG: gliding motility-associated C-terminal domain-containing protein [Bacteroidota bacterium]